MRPLRRPLPLLAALLSVPAVACASVLGFDEGAPTDGAAPRAPDAGRDAATQPPEPEPPEPPAEDSGGTSPEDALSQPDAAPEAGPSTAPGCLTPRADYFCTGYDGPTPAVGPEVADEMYSFTADAPRSAPRSLRGEYDRRTGADAMMETRTMAAPRRRLRASVALRVGRSGTAVNTPTVFQLVPTGQSQGWRVMIDVAGADVGFTVRGLQYVPHTVRAPRGAWIEIAVELLGSTMSLVVNGKAVTVATNPIAPSWDVSWGAAFGEALMIDFDDVTVDAR